MKIAITLALILSLGCGKSYENNSSSESIPTPTPTPTPTQVPDPIKPIGLDCFKNGDQCLAAVQESDFLVTEKESTKIFTFSKSINLSTFAKITDLTIYTGSLKVANFNQRFITVQPLREENEPIPHLFYSENGDLDFSMVTKHEDGIVITINGLIFEKALETNKTLFPNSDFSVEILLVDSSAPKGSRVKALFVFPLAPAPTKQNWSYAFTEQEFSVIKNDFHLKTTWPMDDFSKLSDIAISSEKLFNMKVDKWDVHVFAINEENNGIIFPIIPGGSFDKPVIQKTEFVTQIKFKDDEITQAIKRAKLVAPKNHKMFMVNIRLEGEKFKDVNIYLPITIK